MTTSVGILIFDGVEILDACGPFEVFSVANRVAARDQPGRATPPFEVMTISCTDALTIDGRGHLLLGAHYPLRAAPVPHVVMVPGGITDEVEALPEVLEWLKRADGEAEIVSSVCNGALVLAAAGLLDGLSATTHWGDQEELRQRYPRVNVVTDARYIDHGHIATSAGVSAGIDLALHLVERIETRELAVATARQMDYPWSES